MTDTTPPRPPRTGAEGARDHEHEWERGVHMAEAFGTDGRRLACAICGQLKPVTPPSVPSLDKAFAAAEAEASVTWPRGFLGPSFWQDARDGKWEALDLFEAARQAHVLLSASEARALAIAHRKVLARRGVSIQAVGSEPVALQAAPEREPGL